MSGDTAIRGMLALCAVILVAAALYLARSIFAPVAFSIFAMAIVWPFQRALQARMPKLIALVFTLLLTLAVLSLLALAVAWGSSQVGQWLLRNLDRFQFIYIKTNEWLEGHGIFATALLADRFDVAWLVGFAQQVAAETQLHDWFCSSHFCVHDIGPHGSRPGWHENREDLKASTRICNCRKLPSA